MLMNKLLRLAFVGPIKIFKLTNMITYDSTNILLVIPV